MGTVRIGSCNTAAMQAILAVTIPFFGLVLLGWVAARLHWLPASAIPGLNAYVLFFALPCLLFRFGASLPFGRLADPVQLGVYLLAALAIIALTIAVTLGRAGRDGVDLRDAALGALVAAFPNAGFMGVPLLVALLGDAAAGPVIGAIVVDLVVTSTICLALAQAHTHRAGAEDRTLAQAAVLSLRGALTNPLPWAIGLGALFAATGRELPGSIGQIVRMLTKGAHTTMPFLESLAAQGGRPVMVAALLHNSVAPRAVFDDLDAIAAANARGQRLLGQVSCCPLTMDFTLASPYPVEGLVGWQPALGRAGAALRAVLADPAFRAGVRAELAAPTTFRLFNGEWDKVHVVETARAENALLEQRSIAEIAAATGSDPLDAMVDLALDENLATVFTAQLLNSDEDAVGRMRASSDTAPIWSCE